MWLAVCARCGVVWSRLNLPVLSSMVTVSFEHFIKNLPCLSVRLFRLPWRDFVQHKPAGLRWSKRVSHLTSFMLADAQLWCRFQYRKKRCLEVQAG